jgi:hypothetical protein
MSTRAKRTTAGDKTICLPIAKEIDYETFVKDTQAFRVYLDNWTVRSSLLERE